jgi:DNA-directed RNA polymerase alpha subunit
MRVQEHGEDNMILSGITGFVLGCAITVIYLNKRFVTIKALLEDVVLLILLINLHLEVDIEILRKNKQNKKRSDIYN